MKVAYAGVPGAWGEEAARLLAGAEPVAVDGFPAVVDAVARGTAELGVLPVHNTGAGPVEETARLLVDGRVRVRELLELPVRQCLLVLPGTARADVRRVTSHPVALAQCARFLADAGWTLVPASNTAVAARTLALERAPGTAVVASRRAAELNGLAVLAEGIEDAPGNATRFAVLVRAG